MVSGDRDASLTRHGRIRRHDQRRGAAGPLVDRKDHGGA
jgi:hypothetical protein